MSRWRVAVESSNLLRKPFLLFLLIFVLTACKGIPAGPVGRYLPQGRVTVILSLADVPRKEIRFSIHSLVLLSETGQRIELIRNPVEIDSISVKGRQVLLADRRVPEGYYREVVIKVKDPFIVRQDADPLGLRVDTVHLKTDLRIPASQNRTIFLRWDVDDSYREGDFFEPRFFLEKEKLYVSSLLLYVTNEASGTVSVIDKVRAEIVDTILVGDRPRGVASGLLADRRRVYVANSGSNSVSIIDPEVNRVEEEVLLVRGVEPVSVAPALINNGRELIFVANFRSNNLSVVDPLTYQEVDSVDVGLGPIRVVADPPLDRVLRISLLESSELDLLRRYRDRFINLYVANYLSNSISVVRVDLNTERAVDVTEIKVGWNPVNLYLDYSRGRLYVANSGSDFVTVVDVIELIRGNVEASVRRINNTGYSVVSLYTEPEFNRLYLLRAEPPQVVVLRPLEDVSPRAGLSPVMGIIDLKGRPVDFVVNESDNRLYVVDREDNSIRFVDRIARREIATVQVGESPYGIAEMREEQ